MNKLTIIVSFCLGFIFTRSIRAGDAQTAVIALVAFIAECLQEAT